VFHGEEGIDAGGVSREFFLVLSRAMFNPGYLLFTPATDNTSVFQPNPLSHWNTDHLRYLRFVGRVVGKALWEGHRLDADFTRSFYKHMLGVRPSFNDLRSVDADYHKNLKWMLDNAIAGVIFETFSVQENNFGTVTDVDLVPGGRDIAVTDDNKREYVRLVTDYKLTTSIRAQITAFTAGFHDIIPVTLIAIFSERELELLICGLPHIDLDDLKANVDYNGWRASDDVITWFWQILDTWSQQDLALLILFVTGTSKVPIEGFSALVGMNGVQPISLHKSGGAPDRLVSAHTCFNQLDVGEYSSKAVMETMLLLAIREGSEGFGYR
jgi:E3 ubiquitin-protein ligase HUWE1